ncbi:hypothetical protein HK096_003299 [Nowakowskiella sp. JEL0078]|nr:hypothetical protein HK096_003299 [Nowakowskiella sp. JEL0078]
MGPLFVDIAGNDQKAIVNEDCNICLAQTLEPLENFCSFPGHLTHSSCMLKWLGAEEKTEFDEKIRKGCPACRQPLSIRCVDEFEAIRRGGMSGLIKVFQHRIYLDWKGTVQRFGITCSFTCALFGLMIIRNHNVGYLRMS